MANMTVSQFWLPPSLDPVDFARAFDAYFIEGKASYIPLASDAHPPGVPDYSYFFELRVRSDRMDEYHPFLRDYAAKHNADITEFPASGFGYSHSG